MDQFVTSLDMLGDLLYLHHHGSLSDVTPDVDIARHRVAFMSIAVFTVKYMQTLLPPEKVSALLKVQFIYMYITYYFRMAQSRALTYYSSVTCVINSMYLFQPIYCGNKQQW